MKKTPQYTLIEQADQLEPLLEAVHRVEEVAIDSEADNLFHYRTRICLAQIMAGREIFLVDMLAGLPLDPLWERLEKIRLVMHGCDFDLRLLYEHWGFVATDLFDTMLAAQLLNLPRIGLASLLEQYFGTHLSKESQKSNWSRRPLTEKMLSYAAMDVYYLPDLRDILQAELVRLGRFEWLRQRCEGQIRAGQLGFPKETENDWRIGGSERLGPRGQAALFELWHWRDAQARRLDVPPFKVVGSEILLKLAAAANSGQAEQALHSINLGKRRRLFPSLQKALHDGMERDPETLPRRRFQRSQPLTPAEMAFQDRIKSHRDRIAQNLGLDPTLIASRAQLAQIAREPQLVDEILLPWQAQLLKEELAMKA